MAQAPTIPVRTRFGSYDGSDPGEVVQLAYDTQVIRSHGLPAVEDIDILPFAPNYRAQYVPDGGHSKHYEIRFRKDYVMFRWMYSTPIRKEQGRWRNRTRLAGKEVELPSPDAGKIIAQVSPVKLSRLLPGTSVFFRRGPVWDHGTIQEYQNANEVRKTVAKAEKKVADRKRKKSRYPSVWDRILSDD